MAPKRKRPDRPSPQDEGASRPSPHKPQDLNLAQQNQHQSARGGRGGAAGRNSRRSSRQEFPPSSPSGDVNSTPVNPSRRNARSAQNQQNQQQNGVESPVPQESSEKVATPAPIPQTRPTAQPSAPPPAAKAPVGDYYYEHLTNDVVGSWEESGRQGVLEAFKEGNIIVASELVQELVRAGLDRRIEAQETGAMISRMVAATKDLEEMDVQEIFLDTISLLDDADTKSQELLHILAATNIPPELIRASLDVPQLQSLLLVRSTFDRMKARKTTNQLYRQANFNLLREETEGYAKLITEFHNLAQSRATSQVPEDAFQRVKALVGAFDLDVGRVLDIILDESATSLVREYRFTVRFLRCSSWWPKDPVFEDIKWEEPELTAFPRWALPSSKSWGYSDQEMDELSAVQEKMDRVFWDEAAEKGMAAFFEIGGRHITNFESIKSMLDTKPEPELDSKGKEVNEHKRQRTGADRQFMKETKTVPPRGNTDAAQLLGFKLRFHASPAREANDILPDNLIHLAALLIKVGFISLRDLYPHLYPADEQMPEEKERLEKEKAEKKRKEKSNGPANALAMAGALVDDTLPPPRRQDAAKSGAATPRVDTKETEPKEELPPPQNQKLVLLKALLLVGALPEALFILGRFPWLMEVDMSLPPYLLRIVNHMLGKLADTTRPLQNREGLQQGKGSCAEGRSQAVSVVRPAKRTLRHLQLDHEDDGSGTSFKYYYDDWTINVPVCQNVEDVFTLCKTFIGLLGVKIGQDTLLLSRLIRWARQSLDGDKSEPNKARWLDLMRQLLVPALSLSNHNPSLNNEIWSLLQIYPMTVRYNLYAEWYMGRTSRMPDMMEAFARTRQESLNYLRRISGESVVPQSRALWKATLCSPGIVMRTLVSQLESYSNMVPSIVDSMRFLNNFAFDVLTWHLLNALSGAGRDRMQGDGMLTSPWLKALARFCALLFTRYSNVQCAPILQYVCHELRKGDSTDLELLEQILSEMAGIKAEYQPNDDQIKAMTQGRKLREETMKQLEDARHEKTKSAARLMKALKDPNLTGQMLIVLEQERGMYPHHEGNETMPLKVMGSNLDKIQMVISQYLEVLKSNLPPSDFLATVPDVTELISGYRIASGAAFTMHRDALTQRITDVTEAETEAEKKPAAGEDTKMTDGDADTSTKDAENDPETSPWHPVLEPLIVSLANSAGDLGERTSISFFVTFWTLNARDVLWFENAYDFEIKKVAKEIDKLKTVRSGLTKTEKSDQERKRRSREDAKKSLEKEKSQMLKNREQTSKRLEAEKTHWFDDPHENKGPVLEQRHTAILQECFLARATLSPMDALFCARMLEVLHEKGTPGFRVNLLFNLLFHKNSLASMIFQFTAKESEYFGRFLAGILKWLDTLHKDKELYEKNGLGKDNTSTNIIGFARRVDENGAAVSPLDYEDFRRNLYNFHASLNGALKMCFESKEYMHIYNGMNVLRAISDVFPQLNFMGKDMSAYLKKHTEQDERPDLKLAALALIGTLKKTEKKWVMPQAFRIPKEGVKPAPGENKASSAKPETPQPGGGAVRESTPKLDAGAPEFKPTAVNGDALNEGVAEDGEINDDKAGASRGDVTMTEAPPAPSEKKEKAAVAESGRATPQAPVRSEPTQASKPPTLAPSTLPAKPLPNSTQSFRDANNRTPSRAAHDLPSKPTPTPGAPQSAPPQRPLPQPPNDRRSYDSGRQDSRSRPEISSYGQPSRERSPGRGSRSERERDPYPSRVAGALDPRYPPADSRYSQEEYYANSRRDQGTSRSQYGGRGDRSESTMAPPASQGPHPDRAAGLQSSSNRESLRSAPPSAPPAQPSNGAGPAIDPSRLAMINKNEERGRGTPPSANQERLGTRDRSSRPSDYGTSRQDSTNGKPTTATDSQKQQGPITNSDDPPTGPRFGRPSQPQRDLFESPAQSGRPSEPRGRFNQNVTLPSQQEMSYGRLGGPQDFRSQDTPPAGPRQPSGPASQQPIARGRGFNNAPQAPTQPSSSARAPESPATMRGPPQEPSSRRSSGQIERQPSSNSLQTQPALEDRATSNIHPSRQAGLASQSPRLQTGGTQGNVSGSAGSPMSGHVPSGPRNGPQPPATPTGPPASAAAPPSGPGGPRRSDRSARGSINSLPQTSNGPPASAGQGVSVRGAAAAARNANTPLTGFGSTQHQMQPPMAATSRNDGPRDSAPSTRAPEPRGQDLLQPRQQERPSNFEHPTEDPVRRRYENERADAARLRNNRASSRERNPLQGPPGGNDYSSRSMAPQDDRRGGRDGRGYSSQSSRRGDAQGSRGGDYSSTRQASGYAQSSALSGYDPRRGDEGMRRKRTYEESAGASSQQAGSGADGSTKRRGERG